MRNPFFRQRVLSLPVLGTFMVCLFFLGGASSVPASGELPAVYLHAPSNNTPALFLDTAAPVAATPKFKDSAGMAFSGGNPWKEIGTWEASSQPFVGDLGALGNLHVFLGLKNSDDEGTQFDLRAEVYRNGVLISPGQTMCVTGVTRAPEKARQVVVVFDRFRAVGFGASDVLSLKVLARIGSNSDGTPCGGHVGAAGVRLYFDAVSRRSRIAPSSVPGPTPSPTPAGTGWNTGVGGNSIRSSLSPAVGPAKPSIAWQAGPSVSYGGQQAVTEGNLVVVTRTNFVGDTTGDVIVGRDLVSGTERWTAHLPISFPDSWSQRVSAIRGGQVYATRAGNTNREYLYALSAADGSILWRSEDLIDEYFTESLAFTDDDPIIGNLRSLTRIDHTNGRTVWKTARFNQASGGNMAAVSGDHIYAWDFKFGADYGAVVAVFDATNGQKLYISATQPPGVNTQVGLVAGADGAVYAPLNSGVLIAFADTGSALVERWRIPAGYTPFASLGIGPDGSVYAYSVLNKILRLEPETGGVRNTSMRIPFDNLAFFPRMAIDSNGTVFLTNGGVVGGAVFSFDADLTLRWSDSVPGVFLGGPALAIDGTLVVCGFDDVRAYKTGGGDWNTGVGGNSARTSLSAAAGPTAPSILWEGGPPALFGEPSVIEGNIVVSTRTEAFGADGSWIVAQDLLTGGELWRVKLPISFADSWKSGVSAIRGGQVYATRAGNTKSEYLYALNATDGSILWQSEEPIDQYADSLAFAANGDPIVGNYSSLTRINNLDGKTVWKTARVCGLSGACMAAVSGDHVYAWDYDSGFLVRAFDATTGNRLYSSAALPWGVFPAQDGPMAGPDAMVYVAIDTRNVDGALAFVALRDSGSALIEEWRIPAGNAPFASFGIGPDGSVYAYSPSNQILRIDPSTGAVRDTSMPIPSFSNFYGPRVAIDSAGRVFLTAGAPAGGTLYSFDADLTLRWTDSVPNVNLGGPALGSNGTLVVCGANVRAYRTPPAP